MLSSDQRKIFVEIRVDLEKKIDVEDERDEDRHE